MAHVHQLDVCDDDQWYPHNFKFLNHTSTPVTVNRFMPDTFPFVPDPGSTDSLVVPPGGRPVKIKPNLPHGQYRYNIDGCNHDSPRTIIIS